MAYDAELAGRMREALAGEAGLTEKRMFGGLAFLVGGRLVASASSQGGMLLRVDPADTDDLVSRAGYERFVMRGKPMDGWLHVDPEVVRSEAELRACLDQALDFAKRLPPA